MSAHRDPTLRVGFDAFDLDEAGARLRCNGMPVPLAPKAFAVLCTLARKPGVLVTKNDLLDAVWGHQHVRRISSENHVLEDMQWSDHGTPR